MYERKYRLTLVGLSPLLMHWDNIEWGDQIAEERSQIKSKDKKNFAAGDDRCPAHTWKGYTYNDGEHIVLPIDNLRTCMMKAGARIELKGKQTYKSLTQSAILFDELYFTFLNSGKQIAWPAVEKIRGTFPEQAAAVRALGFRLMMKRAAVGQTKHVRVRPCFDSWSTEGMITVIDEQMTEEVLTQLWHIAGFYFGLCDWRPGSPKSPGAYGRYTAEIKAA